MNTYLIAYLSALLTFWISMDRPSKTFEVMSRAASSRVEQVTDYAAILQFRRSPGNIVWPNGGDVPVIAFGWGTQRPLPIEVAIDSSSGPMFSPGATPTLTIQKRRDIFSPLLQELLVQNQNIESVNFTINSARGGPQTYTLYDARIAGIRDVGQFVAETSPTEEIVIAFGRMTLPGQ